MASTFRLYNDQSLIDSVQINDTVKSRLLFTQDGGYNIRNLINGVNRINFFCPEAGSYRVSLSQYVGKVNSDGAITSLLSSPFHSGGTFAVFSTSVSVLYGMKLSSAYTLVQALTSAATVLTFNTANLSANYQIALFQNWTTPNLIASIPLAPIYNDNFDYSFRSVFLEFSGIASAPVEVAFTQEANRTAVTS